MSLIRALLRYIDPIEHRQIEAERKRQLQTPFPEIEPDNDGDAPTVDAEIVKILVCRVCDRKGRGRFCLHCLAETLIER